MNILQIELFLFATWLHSPLAMLAAMCDAYPEGERESEMGGEREMVSRPNLKTSLAKKHARQRQQQ